MLNTRKTILFTFIASLILWIIIANCEDIHFHFIYKLFFGFDCNMIDVLENRLAKYLPLLFLMLLNIIFFYCIKILFYLKKQTYFGIFVALFVSAFIAE
jgi:hypothetical protein